MPTFLEKGRHEIFGAKSGGVYKDAFDKQK
jgi:hypothetical protein